MDKESAKAKETAKKLVTRKANPYEGYEPNKLQESGVDSAETLAARGLKSVSSATEALAQGYDRLEFQSPMDPFDNERNYTRVRGNYHDDADCKESQDPHPDIRAYNQNKPAPGYGSKEKVMDQDGEDYGHHSKKSDY